MTNLPDNWPVKPENEVSVSIHVLVACLIEEQKRLKEIPNDEWIAKTVAKGNISDLKLAIKILQTSERIKP
jgi:hypothetical protein